MLYLLDRQLAPALRLLGFHVPIEIDAPGDVLPVFVSGAKEYLSALRAMQAHRSQLVGFRWLYLAFSRYMWVNEWVEVKVDGGEAL
jgi:N-acetylglucosaminylphosphatidylinositol deacetylase